MTDPLLAGAAGEPIVWLVLFAWGVAEGVAAPIVPDVGVGLLALATPAALGMPLAAAIAGGVGGACLLAALRRRRPALVGRIMALQPGLGPGGVGAAGQRIARRGRVSGFAQLGPGLPLKAYVVAYLSARPDAPLATIAGLALVNRFTRIVPVVAGFAVLGTVARPLAIESAPAIAAYAIGWTVFYAIFWTVRPGVARNP